MAHWKVHRAMAASSGMRCATRLSKPVPNPFHLPIVCRKLRGFGYEGIEIAPSTLAAHPLEVYSARRRELRAIMAGEGISFVGLHFLLVGPTPPPHHHARSGPARKKLAICTPSGRPLRRPRPRRHYGLRLPEPACGDRRHHRRPEARRHFVDGLANLAPHADRPRRDDPGGGVPASH